MTRVQVLVFNTPLGVLDYKVPNDMNAVPGSIVTVPLGPRRVMGIVWETKDTGSDNVPDKKLRSIHELLPSAPLAATLRQLIAWAAQYYCAPLAAVARMATGSNSALHTNKAITEYRLTEKAPDRLTPKREKAMESLVGVQATLRELSDIAQVSQAVLRGMVAAGLLEAVSVTDHQPYPPANPDHAVPELSDAQTDVTNDLINAVQHPDFDPIVLDGVTGSGKTECYFEAIATALRLNRQALILLPEIVLTENFLHRFEDRFGAPPVVWHSSIKSSERKRAWRAISEGHAQVVIGARSALFLPFSNLGLIVVDEAHETSFKQDDGVRYNARDVAVIRAKFEKIPVILASATPALETMELAKAGVYRRLVLETRYGGASLPTIHLIDLCKDPPERGRWIAPPLVSALNERAERGEQSLLFLNRRGYAPLTLCRNCGHRFQCPHCSAWLVEHRSSHYLGCHHCGYGIPMPDTCPECGEKDSLVPCGPGVERIADEVASLMPDARLAVATSDTLNTPEHINTFVTMAQTGAIDVIIGTQLVTKGYHFPNLTLVGVIDADLGLEGGDLRASERTYQQIAQVAGRAGRASKPGEVLIQTHCPEAPVIAALATGNRDAFYEAEALSRRDAGAPPFARWAAVIISSENAEEARDTAAAIGKARPDVPGITILGPAPAPLSLLRGRYRHRFLINARRSAPLQRTMGEWLRPIPLPRGVRVSVDIDPYSFV